MSSFDKIRGARTRTYDMRDMRITSVMGKSKDVTDALKAALKEGQITPNQIVMFGFKGDNVHMVTMNAAKGSVTKDDIAKMRQDDYFYGHMISAMIQGVNIALFDKGFEPDEVNGKAYGRLASAIFYKGHVRGSQSNTLLLIGGGGTIDRVLVANQFGYKNPLRKVAVQIEGDTRYTVAGKNTIIAAKYGTSQVAALNVQEAVSFIQTDEPPHWKSYEVTGAQIEDMSVSIGSTTTIAMTLTLEGKRQLIAANSTWLDGNRRFALPLVRLWSIDMPVDKAPIVRIDTEKQMVAAVDGNGNDRDAYQASDIGDFFQETDAFVRFATDAVQGTILDATA